MSADITNTPVTKREAEIMFKYATGYEPRECDMIAWTQVSPEVPVGYSGTLEMLMDVVIRHVGEPEDWDAALDEGKQILDGVRDGLATGELA